MQSQKGTPFKWNSALMSASINNPSTVVHPSTNYSRSRIEQERGINPRSTCHSLCGLTSSQKMDIVLFEPCRNSSTHVADVLFIDALNHEATLELTSLGEIPCAELNSLPEKPSSSCELKSKPSKYSDLILIPTSTTKKTPTIVQQSGPRSRAIHTADPRWSDISHAAANSPSDVGDCAQLVVRPQHPRRDNRPPCCEPATRPLMRL
ncbi:hypothetical protein C8R43DRAFT_1100766, partial [Mycena crocata]